MLVISLMLMLREGWGSLGTVVAVGRTAVAVGCAGVAVGGIVVLVGCGVTVGDAGTAVAVGSVKVGVGNTAVGVGDGDGAHPTIASIARKAIKEFCTFTLSRFLFQ